jgi:DNA-3-methyladenine glycosylase II
VTFLRSLAQHVIDGSLELDRLHERGDDAVMAELVAVKGLGPWTAQSFLIFTLGRPDVMISGDLGIRRAVERIYGLETIPAAKDVDARGEAWRPWRSYACRYLWLSLDNAPL